MESAEPEFGLSEPFLFLAAGLKWLWVYRFFRSNHRVSCFRGAGGVGPTRTACGIQYDQICRGLALAALLETTPAVVLLKNKPVATDL